MYADLNSGAYLLSNQMPCLLKASRILGVVVATLLQMDKVRLIGGRGDVTLIVWLFIEYFTVLMLIICT